MNTSPLTHRGNEIARLLDENAHLREIEAANKETIKYWRGQYAQAQSEVNFYDGIVLGDGNHDKVMLARDGDIFIRMMKMLGMDVSGSDVQEIADRVEKLRGQVADLTKQNAQLRDALNEVLPFVDVTFQSDYRKVEQAIVNARAALEQEQTK